MPRSCFFCKEYRNLGVLPGDRTRKFYEDDFCQVILEMEQSTKGYALVIPHKHFDTIADDSITNEEITHLYRVIQKIVSLQKKILGAENVYVCTLCDGLKHLHFHLIPRYKWTDKDKERYRELFLSRDGEASVDLCTTLNMIGGFWYMADLEHNFKETEFGRLPHDKQWEYIENLANEFKNNLKESKWFQK